MSLDVTPEMQLACDAMRELGIAFYVTRRSFLSCGCVVNGGYRTDTVEPSLGFAPCDNEAHKVAFAEATKQWGTPELNERFPGDDLLADEVMRILVIEEIAKTGETVEPVEEGGHGRI